MPSKTTVVRRLLVASLALAWLAAAAAPTEAGRSKRREREPAVPAPGNLAVSELDVHEIRAPGAVPRFLLRATVSNPGAEDRVEPFRVIFRSSRGEGLGVCEGEAIARGETLLCELWAQVDSPHEVKWFVASLDRDFSELGAFDAHRADDEAEAPLAQGSGAPRIERFEVLPRVLQGMGEVKYDFSIERGHLVWLIAEDKQARLVAGHPADGLLDGQGRIRIRTSGPVTIVARDTEGSYVYATIPVTNLHAAASQEWATKAPPSDEGEAGPADTSPGRVVARPFHEGESAGDRAVLESLVEYLANRRWAWANPGLRPELIHRARPRPANVLNPKR